MKILFLLSSLEPAGSETYCLALAHQWKDKHQVYWISDRLHGGQAYESLPISRKAFPGGVVNTFKVAAFVRRHGIEIIHSHSRRAHWVAAQTARMTGARHVSTIHQPPPVHLFSKLFPCFGDETIAIDEVIVDHLVRHFRRPENKIHLIRNGIEMPPVVKNDMGTPKTILLIGRLTGGRWAAFQFFLDVIGRIAKTLPAAHFKIIGRIPEERREALAAQLASVQSLIAPSTIETLGYSNDLASVIRSAYGVIAGGRSAMESMAAGKPAIVLGEGGILGLANPDIWSDAMRTNLGDHLAPRQFYPAKLEVALRELLTNDARAAELGIWGRAQIGKYYDIREVAPAVEKVYQCLISPS